LIERAASGAWRQWLLWSALAIAGTYADVADAQACSDAGSDCADCQDHVQPFADPDGYFAALKTLLVGVGERDAYVIWAQTFLPESALSLRRDRDTWHVRLTYVQEQVWHWNDSPGGQSVPAFRTQQAVEAHERELPNDLASDIVRTWRDVLSRTRAQSKATTITDGVGYVFSAGGLVGQDANLRCGMGDEMLIVATDLAKYVQASDPLSRWSIRVRLRHELDRIERNEYAKTPSD
jgi:hypothetical protein